MPGAEDAASLRPVPDPEILFVALADGLGGSMRSLATVMDHLDGYRRVVACPDSRFVEVIRDKGCVEQWIELPDPHGPRLRKRLGAAALIARHAFRHRAGIVAIHANGLSERTIVALAAIVSRRPVVVWVHEWKVSAWSSRLNRMLSWLTPGTTFVGVSGYSEEMLGAAGIAPRSKVEVVPNPVDADQVAGGTGVPESSTVPRSAGVTVGYLGTPARYKGFHLLPALIRATEGDPVHWVVYSGPRQMMPEVWAELESLPVSQVTLHAKTADVGEAYASCDVVCCPSFEESFGRVAAEAMANGIPVVASDLPALREVVGGVEGGGILVAPGDVDALAAAIRRLAGDAGLRAELAERGVALSARFEPKEVAEALASLYRRAAATRT